MSAFLQSMTKRISNSPSIPGKLGYVALTIAVGIVLACVWVLSVFVQVIFQALITPSKYPVNLDGRPWECYKSDDPRWTDALTEEEEEARENN
jgi:hypothetical protein